jgi:hypothetical protein
MMNAIESASAVILVCAVAAGALIIMPRPKPEPPQNEKQPAVERIIESDDLRPATQRAEPLTDAQRVDNLGDKLDSIETDVRELKELVRLQQVVRRQPDEHEGKRTERERR